MPRRERRLNTGRARLDSRSEQLDRKGTAMRYLVLGACFAMLACSEAPPAEENPPERDEVYSLTIITQNADGTVSTTTRQVSRSAQITAARAATKEAAGAAMRSSPDWTTSSDGVEELQQGLADFKTVNCPANYLWLFVGSNLTGDELCLHGPAAWNLAEFGLAGAPASINWAGKVRSFWAGDEPGFFAEHLCNNQNSVGAYSNFTPYQRNNYYTGISNYVFENASCL
jgi:hypothetical protein